MLLIPLIGQSVGTGEFSNAADGFKGAADHGSGRRLGYLPNAFEKELGIRE
jgi:hypothetical protein